MEKEFVKNESHILSIIDNDFVVRGVYMFQTDKYLFMVMEYMNGGDLANVLSINEKVHGYACFNDEASKYYLA